MNKFRKEIFHPHRTFSDTDIKIEHHEIIGKIKFSMIKIFRFLRALERFSMVVSNEKLIHSLLFATAEVFFFALNFPECSSLACHFHIYLFFDFSVGKTKISSPRRESEWNRSREFQSICLGSVSFDVKFFWHWHFNSHATRNLITFLSLSWGKKVVSS